MRYFHCEFVSLRL